MKTRNQKMQGENLHWCQILHGSLARSHKTAGNTPVGSRMEGSRMAENNPYQELRPALARQGNRLYLNK